MGEQNLAQIISKMGNGVEEWKRANDERLGEFEKVITQRVDSLVDRIEASEAIKASPGALAQADGQKAYQVHYLDGQKVFEIPAKARLSDIPELRSGKAPEVSLERWLGAAMLGEKCRDRQAVEFARELKSIDGGTTGTLIPEQFMSAWIDNLRARMVLGAAGATTVTMADRTQTHSRVLTDPTVGWRAESGALTASDPTFELRQLTAKSVYTRVQGSVELAADSPDFGRQLMNVMANALAAEIDRAGLRGSGSSNEPQGILGSTGVNQVTGVGALSNYDDFLDAIALLWSANVPESRVGAIAVSPTTLKNLRKLKTGLSGDQTTLVPPPGLPPFLATTALENNDSPATSTAIVGDWADLLFGVRREASVEALRLQTYASNLQIEYVAWARVDFMLRRPASFTTVEGINN